MTIHHVLARGALDDRTHKLRTETCHAAATAGSAAAAASSAADSLGKSVETWNRLRFRITSRSLQVRAGRASSGRAGGGAAGGPATHSPSHPLTRFAVRKQHRTKSAPFRTQIAMRLMAPDSRGSTLASGRPARIAERAAAP